MLSVDFLRFVLVNAVYLTCCFFSGIMVMKDIDAGGLVVVPLMLLSWVILAAVIIPHVSGKKYGHLINPMSHSDTVVRTGHDTANYQVNQRQAYRMIFMIVFWTSISFILILPLRFTLDEWPDYIWPLPVVRSSLYAFGFYARMQLGIAMVLTLMHASFASRGLLSKLKRHITSKR